MTQVQGGGGAGNGTIATARWQGGLRPPAQVVLDGSSFKSDCRPEDVESREMKPGAEGASAPQGGGPSGRPATVILARTSSGTHCEAILVHGYKNPYPVEVRIRSQNGGWSGWTGVRGSVEPIPRE
jgi:hypothetical protein